MTRFRRNPLRCKSAHDRISWSFGAALFFLKEGEIFFSFIKILRFFKSSPNLVVGALVVVVFLVVVVVVVVVVDAVVVTTGIVVRTVGFNVGRVNWKVLTYELKKQLQ